jgi:CheY-like chemotaxis protein
MSAIGKAAGRVLVVEDEALVRLSAREEIEAAGFKVYEANNADEAIRLLGANSDIELVFTDVDMPGSMDGVKLAHYVRTRWRAWDEMDAASACASRAEPEDCRSCCCWSDARSPVHRPP